MRRELRFLVMSIGTAVCLLALSPVASCRRDLEADDILAGYDETATYEGLTIDYPLDETLFPPEIVPPTFRWTDHVAGADTWLVTIALPGGGRLSFVTGVTEWTPAVDDWEAIKQRSLDKPAGVTILGVNRSAPESILSGGRISISTSGDEVGAPIFYREVNLPFIDAVKDPSRIRWRFGSISSRQQPPIVLEKLPVCGNCHSFSADGRTLGMDVDYANDKGSYAIAPVREEIGLSPNAIITWSDYRRDDGEDTYGLLSQVSPDGKYVVSTVKDRSVFVAKPELAFSQLFFPIKGILAVYDKETGAFRALPGADDPAFVQSNPTWSPDGKHIVFARSTAYRLRQDKGNVLLSQAECAEFLEEGQTFLFDLYRIPFNEGAGGVPEPLEGASHNGMSNFFAKYSPDGKWIVFCKARSFMLLQPDSALYIIPAEGGEARRLRCNTGRMNSWHSWSPSGKWLVFSSKANSPYTQLFLTHIDEQGRSTPPVLLAHFTASDRAANIPEFVNARPDAIKRIREHFVDDVSYVRAGDTYLAADDVAGAIGQYRKALELNPGCAVAHSNLGGLLSTEGQFDEAETHLRAALRLDPESGAAHFNLGIMLFRQGRNEEATEHLAAAVRLKPEHATAQRTLGVLLANKGMPEQAISHLREAVRLEPDNTTAHYCLAKALVGQRQTEEAIEHLRTAVRLEPDYATAHYLLGQVLFHEGQTADAIAHLSSAAHARPDDAQLLRDLAWVLATVPESELRDAAQAVGFAKRACALTRYQAIEPLDTLGVCYAAAGEFAEAIRAAEQALRLARAAGQAAIADKIVERIELYQQRIPYRPPSTSVVPEGEATKGGVGE
jgi:tetratricopeptide (TPR) repeat protein